MAGQRRVDVLPGLGGVGLAEGIGGERGIDVANGQAHVGAGLALDQRQAVDSDRDLDHLLDAVLGAILEFGGFHPPRGVGHVRELVAHSAAEQLHAGAGAGRFDDRAPAGIGALELLGDRGGEGVDGRRTDDLDLLALSAAAPAALLAASRDRDGGERRRENAFVHSCLQWPPIAGPRDLFRSLPSAYCDRRMTVS
jgi:hypothetical protein